MAAYVQRACVLCLLGCVLLPTILCIRYEPNWKSLDSRKLPDWYDESKIGIFIVWGLYAVPGVQSEWFWELWRDRRTPETVEYMKANFKPDFTYPDFAADFSAEFFDPDHWMDVIQASGAKYIVLTTKHHDGYDLWPSKYSFSWNSGAVGPNKDIVGAVVSSLRNKTKDIHLGLYHSLFEWYNPLYLQDKKNNWTTNEFVKFKTMPELYELVEMYGPDVIWSDGEWEAPDTYWNSTEFLAWLYNDSPVKNTVVTNDRWGKGIMCKHGGFLTCTDRYNPGTLQKRKWENAMTIDQKSWGFRRDMTLDDVMSTDELIGQLVETVSCGGNILINIGPTKEGTIVPVFEERLRELGEWLGVNGEAIYGTKPWTAQNDTKTPHVWYTSKMIPDSGLVVYAIVLSWPAPGDFYLDSATPTPPTKITLLGYAPPIAWQLSSTTTGIKLVIPAIPFNKMPCKYAWVFRMTNLA